MTSCIFTVIKNEHQYLDEWIQYHLNLGIDHIFIFEDLDSNSHKEIVDKYSQVSLDRVKAILSVEEIQLALELKQTKRRSVHLLYTSRGLSYLKRQFSNIYDWCFMIDNDEFLTLGQEYHSLSSILHQYSNYDALVLSWQCFGANNQIYQPDYKEKSTFEIYTDKINYNNFEKPGCCVKTCYNLNTYQSNFFRNSHYPSNSCNWCNTSFIKDNISPQYDILYLRHYITRSWEEYYQRVTNRGYMWGKRRGYDFFFKINPSMLDQKDMLLNLFKKQLVVLPYIGKRAQGNELDITLRAWEKFCQFQYHFVVIGEFSLDLPSQYPWVEFIYCPTKDKIQGQYNPHLDIQNKMEITYNRFSQYYPGFIYLTDDEYAIKPFELKDITTIYYHEPSFVGVKSAPTSFWKHDKWKTRQLLDKENLPHINYTTHYPCYFKFNRLKEIWDKYNMREESYVFDDVYFNSFEHEEPILDSTIRLGIWSQEIFKNNFQKAIEDPNIKFVCNSVQGWSPELEKSLRQIIE